MPDCSRTSGASRRVISASISLLMSGTSGTRTGKQTVSWTHAPHLIEEVYNLEDALVCAQFLNSFLRHADTRKDRGALPKS